MTLSVTLSADLSPIKKIAIIFGGPAMAKALADSLNGVAFDSQRALQALTLKEFDRPIPFTQRAFGVEKATNKTKDIVARVFVRDIQAKYLGIQIKGGIRKKGDYATTAGGPLTPGGSIQLTESGNFPQGPKRYLAKKLAGGAKDKRGFIRSMDNGFGFVFGRIEGEQRTIELLAVIKPNVRYKARFHFVETIDKVFQTTFDSHFARNVAKLQSQVK